ncbi:MAG TPA: 4Fe-4S ferredoxin, partial [Candidatus Brevibacterium intestinavium]|nr:4Fe-4S ferredoxin [Candidatus Brevibacterium intestinavium]
DHEDMVDQAHDRVAELHAKGLTEARLYGANPNDGVGGIGSVFLILDEPEVYGLPPDPRVPTKDLPGMFAHAGAAALGMVAAAGLAFLGSRR